MPGVIGFCMPLGVVACVLWNFWRMNLHYTLPSCTAVSLVELWTAGITLFESAAADLISYKLGSLIQPECFFLVSCLFVRGERQLELQQL
jgi:hypothetical protein